MSAEPPTPAFTICAYTFARVPDWRQIDLCFLYWRWLEYSVSAPLMVVGIAIITGMREQNDVRTAQRAPLANTQNPNSL